MAVTTTSSSSSTSNSTSTSTTETVIPAQAGIQVCDDDWFQFSPPDTSLARSTTD